MIGADEVFRVAVVVLAELHASVGTPISENIDPAVLVTRHDNWTIADPGSFKIPRIGDFRIQRDIVPRFPAEYALHFALVNFCIRI